MEKLYSGDALYLTLLKPGLFEITLDNQTGSVNTFNQKALKQLGEAVHILEKQQPKGLLITSAKDSFVVGADINEFIPLFKKEASHLREWLFTTHKLFNCIEDLDCPTVALINGICLGGGLEAALTTDFRLAAPKAKLGLPETKLGIIPGWGGTVRLPRMIGADNAIEWIAGGKAYSAEEAFNYGVVQGVVAEDKLKAKGLELLENAQSGKLDWQGARKEKLEPLTLLSKVEHLMAFSTAKAFVASKSLPHYPAPIAALTAMEEAASKSRSEAQELEVEQFLQMTQTPAAESLVSIFLSDQYNKKQNKKRSKQVKQVQNAAVVGAGIMGGGIAYQSAATGTPIVMKDISSDALELGQKEAATLFNKQVKRKKLNAEKALQGIGLISKTLNYGDFENVDVVVEAVVENANVKKAVLKELEEKTAGKAILTSNTSTISITSLAESLKNPENFCGMHFFNPVHRMPLVEVIKGEKTSEATIDAVVSYALKLKKVPIVVKDCPGFLVNRVLFPYFYGFLTLANAGVDFQRVDKVMERFGWPMGPAYLLDVIGLDTAVHAYKVMAEAFPERMSISQKTASELLVENKMLGQKSGEGFYQYKLDKKGKLQKTPSPTAQKLMDQLVTEKEELDDAAIIHRLMVPMVNESVHCLSESIVQTPMELDLALLNGLGFPPFRAGAIKYLDDMGHKEFLAIAKQLTQYGGCYVPPQMIEQYAEQGKNFYPQV